MRICLVSQDFPPETGRGGTGTQTHTKAHGLAALGHDIHVLSHSTDEARHDYEDGAVRVTRIPGADHTIEVRHEAVRWLAYSQLVAAAIDELQAESDFDLVDFPEYGAEAFVWLLNRVGGAPKATIHLQGPLVMLAHALGWPDVDSPLYRVGTFMEATSLRLADRIYSSSALSARWVADHYGLDANSIPVIHAGVDVDRFSPRGVAREERPTVVFIGKIGPSKGADVLVDACCRVADRLPNLRLRLFGSVVGSWDDKLRRRAADAGHPNLIQVAGFLSREHMPEELSRAHVFAAPSPYEGGPGFVYLEAMACGLPVLACSGSGIEEVITDGDNGRLVPPGDPESLAAALLAVLGKPRYREEMSIRARSYVLEQADSRSCVRRIADFLMAS